MVYHRKIDDMGRLVLPMEYRAAMGATDEQTFDITLEDGRMVLTLGADDETPGDHPTV